MFMNRVPQKQSYAQAAGPSVSDILKLKKNYPNLSAKKIENIQRIINDSGKSKPWIRMTTKSPSYKQIIVSMGKNNTNKFMAFASNHIPNINRALKNIKSDVLADYVQQESTSITIVANKVALPSNLQTIENIIKNVENINSEDIKSPRLLQSKSYLKIIGIPFFIKNTNVPIMSDYVKKIIKSNYIFNNLSLALKL